MTQEHISAESKAEWLMTPLIEAYGIDGTEIIQRIAQAIREAENAAYERVAAWCDEYDYFDAGMPQGTEVEITHLVSDDIAKFARSLKSKGTP